MQNKLPEVGKRYRPTTNKPMSRNNIEITEAPRVSHTEGNMSLEFFLDNYEELPEDNSNQSKVERKTEVQVGYEFAKEDLEKELEQIDDSYFFNAEFATEDLLQKQLARLIDKSQNLINALDSQEPKVNVSVDFGREGGDMTCETYWKKREDGKLEIIDTKYKEPKVEK